MSTYQICTRCIYDSHVSAITFDEEGVCNYCRQVEDMERQYGTGSPRGMAVLEKILDEIKQAGRGKRYDCIIGVSGGTDSSYLLLKAKEWGLRPLAVHYDNSWNTDVAEENIRRVTEALGIDLFTYKFDPKESEDLYRAFLLAGVPEFDASTDIAFVQVIRQTAAKHRVKYILEGHSFKAEGISPMGRNYFDGQYIADIHRKYGTTKLKTYPNLTFWRFLKWAVLYRQKFIRPLWYMEYTKEAAQEILREQTGWEYYGGHHLENRATAFLHTVYNPQKFQLDNRNWSLAANARLGTMSREEALEIYRKPIEPDAELVAYVKKRLGFSDEEFERVMNSPKRTFREFCTYKKRFERLRPLFYVLAKSSLVPMSFYLKYCLPLKED